MDFHRKATAKSFFFRMKKIIRNFYSKIFLHVSLVMSSKRQTVLSGQAFKAQVQLTDDVVKEWCVASLDDAASELLDDWQGKIIAMVGLTLTADNRNVENARFLLQGSMYDNAPKKIPANKFWKNFPSGTYILLKNVDSSLFKFEEGMVSNFVSHDQLDFEFRARNGDLLEPEDLETSGMRGFTLKAFVWPTASCWASINLVCFPFPERDLVDSYPLSADDRCPGILFVGEKIPFGPPASTRWGAPFNPAILPGAPVDLFSRFPPAVDLSRAMAELLRKAKQPALKLNVTQLEKVFSHQTENSHDVSSLDPLNLEIIWPAPPADTEGWCCFFS